MGSVVYLTKRGLSNDTESAEIIRSIRPIMLYFMHYGRNAWHSTWIARYRPQHFFRDIRSVHEEVESRKWQGSVLKLDVLPALQFDFTRSKFILAEINTERPFQYFERKQLSSIKGLSRERFLDEASKSGVFWKDKQIFENHVIIQQVDRDFMDFHSARVIGSSESFFGHNTPLKPGFYKREIREYWTRWSLNDARFGGNGLRVSSFNSALKALVTCLEAGARWA